MSRVLRFEVPPGKPVLRGQDHFWKVIRDLDPRGAWSVSDILGCCGGGVDRSTVRDYVKRLVAGSHAEEVVPFGGMPHYRLLKSPMATPRLRRDGTPAEQGRGQIAMWNVMRGPLGRDGFTFRDLALYASGEAVKVTPITAQTYVRRLADAGMLHCLREGGTGQPAMWRLKPAYAGPLPPMVLRGHIVFDQNKGEAVGPVDAQEVAL